MQASLGEVAHRRGFQCCRVGDQRQHADDRQEQDDAAPDRQVPAQKTSVSPTKPKA